MQIKTVSIVLLDISGYTRFIKYANISLLHAEEIITELLEAVIDAAEFPLTLSKLEGDAAFLYATSGEDEKAATRDVLRQIGLLFLAFNSKARFLAEAPLCPCDACAQISQLRLKAVLHFGKVAFKQIRQFEELAGEDVILAHRLLKNSIQAKEYVLMTERFYQLSGGFSQGGEIINEQVEDFGAIPVRAYYDVDLLGELSQTEVPDVEIRKSYFQRLKQQLRHMRYSMRRLFGARRAGEYREVSDPEVELRSKNIFSRIKWMLGKPSRKPQS